MTDLNILEKRWAELASKPKSKEEIEEVLLLGKKIELERAKEYKGLINELAGIGINITSIWDLVNTKAKYPHAITYLLKYLPMVTYERNKEGIIRALTVSEAKGVAIPVLLNEYLKLPKEKENLRWIIGNAVNVIATKNDVETIIPIVLDKENGPSRQMFVSALGKIKNEKIKNVLLQLINDDDKVIRDEAQKVLKKFK